jgi:heme exporter protein CcmD
MVTDASHFIAAAYAISGVLLLWLCVASVARARRVRRTLRKHEES